MSATTLVLRDVHVPATPSLWPPAPGWWLVFAVALAVLAMVAGWWWFRRRRRRRWQRLFEEACAQPEPVKQIAAISDLLRRAARRIEPKADRLQGEDWLRFLDGQSGGFSTGAGRIVLDGGYRRQIVDSDELERFRTLARGRFLQLMAGRR
ncbi:DUF4381 domain-containing protein [Pseudoxanthomonas wuyuanensis]